jgi:hypothetical protein
MLRRRLNLLTRYSYSEKFPLCSFRGVEDPIVTVSQKFPRALNNVAHTIVCFLEAPTDRFALTNYSTTKPGVRRYELCRLPQP